MTGDRMGERQQAVEALATYIERAARKEWRGTFGGGWTPTSAGHWDFWRLLAQIVLDSGVVVPKAALDRAREYGLKQRRRAQDAEDELFSVRAAAESRAEAAEAENGELREALRPFAELANIVEPPAEPIEYAVVPDPEGRSQAPISGEELLKARAALAKGCEVEHG